jgi:transcriptional regulator with XRE-family HTH domain
MGHWLVVVAKELREAAGRKTVHIAASMSKDQSTVYRFEQGGTSPRDIDIFIAAYADDLDIKPSQIWERALQLWREDGAEVNVHELLRARDEEKHAELPQPGSALRRRGKARSPNAPSRSGQASTREEAS